MGDRFALQNSRSGDVFEWPLSRFLPVTTGRNRLVQALNEIYESFHVQLRKAKSQGMGWQVFSKPQKRQSPE
ncbi:hypothetical protein ABIA48_005159 [Pseudomonas sp. S30_BP2TU TE3576]|jgi:hypothetical protein|uniref:hypothetical protein n=1 Tax=Pseudomonas sp. S30_BP2TU TE3576 TaxID=3349329 RepID=UPI003D240C36